MPLVFVKEQKVEAGARLGSMILDHFIMTMIAMIFAVPGMVVNFAKAFEVTHEQNQVNFFGKFMFLSILGFALYLCKDSINGRSVGKLVTKMQVVNNATGEVASPFRCLIRNIFCIIWPIEVIFVVINPERRLGDIVAGTKVALFDPETNQPKPDLIKTGLAIILAYLIMLLFASPFYFLQKSLDNNITYVESSFNLQSSKATEKVLSDSLGDYLTADVKVYDKIVNKNLKYVSVILFLKKNYLEDDSQAKELKSMVTPIIYGIFPEKTFSGKIKMVYRSDNNMQMQTSSIGQDL